MSSDNEDEVCILSPAEWSMSQSCFRRKCSDVQTSIGKLNRNHKICRSDKFTGDCGDIVECQGVGKADLVDLFALGRKSDKQSEVVFEFKHIDDDEHRGTGSLREFINLNIGRHDQPEGLKVREALKLFEEQYTKILEERKTDPKGEGKGTKHVHLEVAERLKAEGVWNFAEKSFGHIPGIEIGDQFRFRAELAVVGLHFQLISGIDYVKLGGKKFATSIVNSGQYENEAKAVGVLIYSGQGGNPKFTDKAGDQKLEKGNLALMNSKEMGYPVRVIYKRQCRMASNMLGMINEANYVYVYDGLYTVNQSWQERDQNGNLVFKFELHRMPGQPRPHQKKASTKSMMPMEVCLEAEQRIGNDEYLFDVSDGRDEGESEVFLDYHMSDDGFAIDAAKMGNIGRFINHSCSPNLYAQEVLYDHQDNRLPHIMFFATKNIPPLQELTYDYT
ncbi:UNVERIFIED_CONTAM: Histone-lysine N-methyltransferase, H3 lysine-9 specific SUVH6 [Sesamum angustifolium]|uniref:Histone-lysine N-methyltransferase, H3 lysine-9 specific SUVH6 n=1 Tax=Sesamum angustifolium TaxID=2727405 RepID=A0AAW2KER2_9LAMI